MLLVVVPLAVSRSCSPRLLRAARAGDERAGAFAMAFLAVNAALILVAAAFSSTPAGLDHLHDRYLFYVVPLWLAVRRQVARGRPPSPSSRRPSGSASLVLPALVPFEEIAAEDGVEVDAVVISLVARQRDGVRVVPGRGVGRRVLALFVVLLVGAVLLVPRRFGLGLVAVVVGVLVASTAIAWRDSLRTADDFEATLPGDRGWVDDAIRDRTPVTSLYVSARCGERGGWAMRSS